MHHRLDPLADPVGVLTEIRAERGHVSLLYQVLLNSAPLAEGWEKLLTAVRNRNSLPADLRDGTMTLPILLAASRDSACAAEAGPLSAGEGARALAATATPLRVGKTVTRSLADVISIIPVAEQSMSAKYSPCETPIA